MGTATTVTARVIGANIRQMRRERGWTQAELADAIRAESARTGDELPIDRSAIAHWEAGRFEPALRYRPILCALFNVDARLLFPQVA